MTDYCTSPEGPLSVLPRVGGTRKPRVQAILDLQPDLVLANQEENSRTVVEALTDAGVTVYLAFPKSVRQALDDLYFLARLFHSSLGHSRLATLERAVEWAEADLEAGERKRYFCPIWKHRDTGEETRWMTFNQDTFAHDLLRLLGGENIFADRQREETLQEDSEIDDTAQPPLRDTRYPTVSFQQVLDRDPATIILPDEPYAFTEEDKSQLIRELEETGSQSRPEVVRVIGSLIFWHGTRMGLAFHDLGGMFR